MREKKLTHYARALVEICRENNCWDELLADLKTVSEKLNESLELKRYLVDRHVTMTKKKESMKDIFRDFIGKRTYNFVFLLIKDQQLLHLDSIIAHAKKINFEHDGIHEALVESAIALTPTQEKALVKVIKEKIDKQIVLRNIINPGLIGGLKVTVGDTELDCSIRGKLERLKRQIQEFE
ncbi:ATP synthase F1 subunit delta [Patescibacteria group bacterium]|nr:ATP synthase F1 subunit delta [Patescibacteria group bacterium]